jgi:hypothetical protein
MLTSDLAINWRRGDKIVPRTIKTDDAGYLRDARVLIEFSMSFKAERAANWKASWRNTSARERIIESCAG